jgi:hypothetical protein
VFNSDFSWFQPAPPHLGFELQHRAVVPPSGETPRVVVGEANAHCVAGVALTGGALRTSRVTRYHISIWEMTVSILSSHIDIQDDHIDIL